MAESDTSYGKSFCKELFAFLYDVEVALRELR